MRTGGSPGRHSSTNRPAWQSKTGECPVRGRISQRCHSKDRGRLARMHWDRGHPAPPGCGQGGRDAHGPVTPRRACTGTVGNPARLGVSKAAGTPTVLWSPNPTSRTRGENRLFLYRERLGWLLPLSTEYRCHRLKYVPVYAFRGIAQAALSSFRLP